MKLSKVAFAASLIILAAAGGNASADGHHGGHGGHGPRVGFGVVIGDPWPFPWYYPPPYYAPPPVVVAPASPPVYIQQAPAQAGNWYHCRNPEGYYPYVRQCPGGWEAVPAQPPPGP